MVYNGINIDKKYNERLNGGQRDERKRLYIL